MSKQAATLFLFLTTMIWGAAFVAQSVTSQYIGAFGVNAIRYLLGFLTILPYYFLKRKQMKKDTLFPYLWAGLLCGGALFIASYFQQLGVSMTSVGKSGFITTLYVVAVPMITLIMYRRKLHPITIIAIVFALIGTYVLCVNENFSINLGDIYCFIGAMFWGLQIVFVERFALKLNGIRFAVYQFLIGGLLNVVCMLLFEQQVDFHLSKTVFPLLYLGVLSTGLGFTAQIIGQTHIEATVSSIIMSLESVFSVIFGFLILQEVLTMKQMVGCIIVFVAVLIAQVNPKRLDNFLKK